MQRAYLLSLPPRICLHFTLVLQLVPSQRNLIMQYQMHTPPTSPQCPTLFSHCLMLLMRQTITLSSATFHPERCPRSLGRSILRSPTSISWRAVDSYQGRHYHLSRLGWALERSGMMADPRPACLVNHSTPCRSLALYGYCHDDVQCFGRRQAIFDLKKYAQLYKAAYM